VQRKSAPGAFVPGCVQPRRRSQKRTQPRVHADQTPVATRPDPVAASQPHVGPCDSFAQTLVQLHQTQMDQARRLDLLEESADRLQDEMQSLREQLHKPSDVLQCVHLYAQGVSVLSDDGQSRIDSFMRVLLTSRSQIAVARSRRNLALGYEGFVGRPWKTGLPGLLLARPTDG